jgi:hypothetical protein
MNGPGPGKIQKKTKKFSFLEYFYTIIKGKYSRGSSIGRNNHDPTLKMEPAYSMCRASRFADRSEYFSSSSYSWERPGTSGK